MVLDVSHMLHMPTHVNAAMGDDHRGVGSDNGAIAADDRYFATDSPSLLYRAYRVHYVLAKLYSSMMLSWFGDAPAVAEKMEQIINHKLLST